MSAAARARSLAPALVLTPAPSRNPPRLPSLPPQRGLLVNDTIVIRYQIELVVSSGGALSRSASKPPPPSIHVPHASLGPDLASLLQSGVSADVQFEVEGEEMVAHKIILQARQACRAPSVIGQAGCLPHGAALRCACVWLVAPRLASC